jgi:hypothetical protein
MADAKSVDQGVYPALITVLVYYQQTVIEGLGESFQVTDKSAE